MVYLTPTTPGNYLFQLIISISQKNVCWVVSINHEIGNNDCAM